MNRNTRASMAKETVEICEAGFYIAPGGGRVELRESLARAKSGTVLYAPETLPASKAKHRAHPTRFSATNETTFAALSRLAVKSDSHIACLNFASAKNPGGGFLNGSLAQEEALACASGLYPCLLTANEYYERNRANRSALYLDLAIFSPRVPFFRDDAGALLEKPVLASIITAPAPNSAVVTLNETEKAGLIKPALQRRAELVLHIARAHDVDRLVLGAWGCGVFRNDPRVVAPMFSKLLKAPGPFADAFEEVVFAVFDRSEGAKTFQAFADQFKEG